jgi:hypothetical protein
MARFADRTGLASARPPQRYLWTDAFAVCNFLGLAQATGAGHYVELALRLADQVHHVLGRHRADDVRVGWISGLGDEEGERHPTRGGLRIGKRLPERAPEDPFDERLEWERDGQYFHYLTRWMHALDQLSRCTRQPLFNAWARELAVTAQRAFTSGARGRSAGRMVWKMSIDLSRPLVPSMGHHDPLDGFITCTQLQATATMLSSAADEPIEQAVAEFRSMIEGRDWVTEDPLGLGGLLVDACRVEQLMARGAFGGGDLLDSLLAAAREGLAYFARQNDLGQPAARRLAFRELGLAIGLHAVEHLVAKMETGRFAGRDGTRAAILALKPYAALGAAIESFWLDPGHRQAPTWIAHRDINDVMLATSLVPAGYIVLHSID